MLVNDDIVLRFMFFDDVDLVYFCFFKQKTAYEMRISDWSSDVCSSDLKVDAGDRQRAEGRGEFLPDGGDFHPVDEDRRKPVGRLEHDRAAGEIGRASCRERVCQYV